MALDLAKQTVDEALAEIRLYVDALCADGWALESGNQLDLIGKLRTFGIPFVKYLEINKSKIYAGIKTGFNEAFIIDEAQRSKLIESNPNSADLIKPWLRGKDIKRWQTSWKNTYALIVPKDFNVEMEKYPAILDHLKTYEKNLRSRGQCEGTKERPGTKQHHWLELDNNPTSTYLSIYERPKIIVPDLSPEPRFYLDRNDYYMDMTAFVIPIEDDYLVGILNSNVLSYFFRKISSSVRGDTLRYKKIYMSQLPICDASDEEKQIIGSYVRSIYGNPGSKEVFTLEKKINDIVYKLYKLNRDEIAIIEGASA